MPISTTHTITTSIMGVGATKRLSAIKWGVVGRIIFAWFLTLPISGGIGYAVLRVLKFFGMQ
jgi:PiT family inorganic phosphate transporter